MSEKRLVSAMLSALSALSSCCANTYKMERQARSYSVGVDNSNRRSYSHKIGNMKNRTQAGNTMRNKKKNKNRMSTNFKDDKSLRRLSADSIRFKDFTQKSETWNHGRDNLNPKNSFESSTNNKIKDNINSPIARRSKSLKDMSTKERLKKVAKGEAILFSVMGGAYVPFEEWVQWPLNRWSLIRKFKKNFGDDNVKKSDTMEIQDGFGWCWLDCKHGLLNWWRKNVYNDIAKLSQKELYKKIFKKNAWPLRFFRRQGGNVPLRCNEKFVGIMNSIDSRIKFKSGFVDYDKTLSLDDKIVGFKAFILGFYEQIGKKPFYIQDSFSWSDGCGHDVNITQIYELSNKKYISIDEPTTGMQIQVPLDDFVRAYWEGKGAKKEIGNLAFGGFVDVNFKCKLPDCFKIEIFRKDTTLAMDTLEVIGLKDRDDGAFEYISESISHKDIKSKSTE